MQSVGTIWLFRVMFASSLFVLTLLSVVKRTGARQAALSPSLSRPTLLTPIGALEPASGTAFAVAVFAAAGLYQLAPLKYRCLSHCRTPLGDVIHYANYRGLLRALRVSVHHGIYCFSCCWSLMALMAAFGFMNLWAMVALATIVGIEKLWSRGKAFGRLTGVVAIALAVVVIFEPGIAPGLDGSGILGASTMVMD